MRDESGICLYGLDGGCNDRDLKGENLAVKWSWTSYSSSSICTVFSIEGIKTGPSSSRVLAKSDIEPIARNAISRLAIRRFIEAYLAGELTPEVLSGYFERPDRPQPKLRL